MSGDTTTTIARMRDAALAMRSVTTSIGDEIKAIETAIRALQAAKCDRLAEMDATKAHEADGASSIGTWGRRELNQDPGVTRQMVRVAGTCRELPAVGEAFRSGLIGFEHVVSFTYALKHVGVEETRLLEEPLLDLARHRAPGELHSKIRHTRAVLHADELDEAWRKGMDKCDIRLAKTAEGWHVTGFLDIETGAKYHAIVKNLSVPRDADDDRTAAQRRMDALREMFTKVLEHGLPADNGVRPHVTVTVEAETLKQMANAEAAKALDLDLKPATLEGFGPIGPQFLAHLMCGAELTPILINTIGKNVEVLDVGRSKRHATPKQAKAIALRQRGVCAGRGCRHPIRHHHHVDWWSDGGLTNLDVMVGLCGKCHTLVHTGRLIITGTHSTGFVFKTARGSPLAQAA